MRMKLMIAAAGLLLSGCSATLTSQDIALDLRSTKNVPIGIMKDSIDVTKASWTGKYSNYKNDLHYTLLSESKGNVREYTDQPLLLSVAFRFRPEFNNSALLGITSCFLPFLAWVPEENNEVYYIDYAVRDNRGNVVHQRSLKGNVSGSMEGWYIGRIDAAQQLRAIEGEYAVKNAARLILKDIDENADTLYAAINAPRLASTPSAQPAPSFAQSYAPSAPVAASPVVDRQSDASARAYQQAKKIKTYAAYEGFLQLFPDAPERREALAAMAAIVGKPKGTFEGYKRFITDFPDGLEFIPQDAQLALIGPEGMRVHDILGLLLKDRVEDSVIAAKIRMQNGIYRDFTFKEISALKKKGMTGVLIEAMLDSTNRAKRSQEEQQKKKEMEALLTDIQHAQRRLDELKAAQTAQTQQVQNQLVQTQVQAPVPVQQSGDTVLADTVKNCAAQVVALEACKRLPGLVQTVCKMTAKSQFPCE